MKPSKKRDMLIEHAASARLSRELVILRDDVPLPVPLSDLPVREPDLAVLAPWLLRMGFRSTLTRLGLEAATPLPPTNPTAATSAEPTPDPTPATAPFGPYTLIGTEAELEAILAQAAHTGVLALCCSADRPDPRHAALLGIGLATAPGHAAYLPLRHQNDLAEPPPTQLDPAHALTLLAPILARPDILKIAHNAKFARLLLNLPLTPFDDTMLISYVQEAGAHGHTIDELARLHLAHTPIAHDEITGSGRARLPYAMVKPDRAAAHMGELADITLRLWQTLRPRLRQARALTYYERIDRRLDTVLIAMEQAGIKIDRDELRRMSAEFAERMAAKETDIHRLAGEPFNLGSPKQLGEMLFDRLGLKGGRRMKTGAWGTDASVLTSLAEEGHEIPALVLEWRQLAKLKSTYADALVEEIDPNTGRVHTSFGTANTTTGRLSSTDPNLQNIPIRTEEGGRIRRAFIAEPGHHLVSADYSQIELRLLAHVADIPVLRESFRNGEDIHARTASEVFNVPMHQMDGATRRRAKAINFGIIYGISAFGLARQLSISAGEAKAYIDAYFARYPGIRRYMEETREHARIHGYVVTPFGRRCWVPGITQKNPALRGYAERQAINAPLQGGAADAIKQAMVALPAALAAAGLQARLLLQVHDELLLEAPQAEAEATAAITRTVMERVGDKLIVPLVVETGTGVTWAAAH